MHYLEQFRKHLLHQDYPAFLSLWEEYCLSDEIEEEEMERILGLAKDSELAHSFGQHVGRAVPLWQRLPSSSMKHQIFRLIIDIETTNSEELFSIVFDYLSSLYQDDPLFQDKIRLIGMKETKSFQGAISRYELLTHIDKGNFVYHTKGWGVGEIVDFSFIREQLTLEFDSILCSKDLSFQNAFHTLVPLSRDHFLSRRFGDPDDLERQAKEDPLSVVHMVLRDLGPKTAAEIKEEMCDVIIPAHEWPHWWQIARTKVKRDTSIAVPNHYKKPFRLRKKKLSHSDQLKQKLEQSRDPSQQISLIYSFSKSFPQLLRDRELNSFLQKSLQCVLESEDIGNGQELQVLFLMQDLLQEENYPPVQQLIGHVPSFQELIDHMENMGLRKRTLVEVRRIRSDWQKIFQSLFLTVGQSQLRDYLFLELSAGDRMDLIGEPLKSLLHHPERYPHALFWYVQKLIRCADLPFGDAEGQQRFFEAFLVVMSDLEQFPAQKELVRKMHGCLIANHYRYVREIFKHSSKEMVQEFLLLITKCRSSTDRDIKISHSLAEVAHPSLARCRKKNAFESREEEEGPIWTTQEGYHKVQKRIQTLNREIVENAREIESAREYGDLRENAEFKAALEKKSRLQSELRLLSHQLDQSRILAPHDVSTAYVNVGTIVHCSQENGNEISYTLLGPWEADPENYIISFQSRLAKALMGKKVGEQVTIQDKTYKINRLQSYFEVN